MSDVGERLVATLRWGTKLICVLPDVKGPEKWNLLAYKKDGRTMIVATHPEHFPITIDPTKEP